MENGKWERFRFPSLAIWGWTVNPLHSRSTLGSPCVAVFIRMSDEPFEEINGKCRLDLLKIKWTSVVFLSLILVHIQRGRFWLYFYNIRQPCSSANSVFLLYSILYSRKFSSAKNIVKSDRQAVRQEFIFVKSRPSFVCTSFITVIVLLLIASLHIHEYFCPHTLGFLTKFSQELNLVKKLRWRKRRN